MIKLIRDVLEGDQYKRIPSNIPFVSLYFKNYETQVKVIQLIECEDNIKLTVQQFEVFCKKAESFMLEKGYMGVELISIVVTPLSSEARKFVLGDNKCWIIDSAKGRLVIFDNQPDDFDGLKNKFEKAINDAGLVIKSSEQFVNLAVNIDGDNKYKSRHETGGFSDEFTLINSILVVVNVVIFIIMSSMGSTEDVDYMLQNGAMYVPAVIENGEYYRFVTCMFLHFGFPHLAGNMVVLLFLGDNVERAVGKIKYLLIYFAGGLIGSCGSFAYAYIYNRGIVSAGASGAIFALIGALLWLVIKNKGFLEDMTTLKVCVLIAYALYSGFISDNIDMAAHLFGLAGGFLVSMLVTVI